MPEAPGRTARLQLHLLALEARQRRGELEVGIESLERRLNRGIHQALVNAADKARQLTKSVQDSLRGQPSVAGGIPGPIGTIMTESVHTCSPDDPLSRAAQIMWEHDCGAVPVLDAEQRPCGMITDRDICIAAYTKGAPLYAIRVAEVMSRHVHRCSPDDSLERAIAVMAEAKVRRLPVVGAGGCLVGMVSLADLLRSTPLLGQREAEQLVFHLLAAVSKRSGTSSEGQTAAAE